MSEFKVGDRVRCIDASESSLIIGGIYEVKEKSINWITTGDYVYVESSLGRIDGWMPSRFELVERPSKNVIASLGNSRIEGAKSGDEVTPHGSATPVKLGNEWNFEDVVEPIVLPTGLYAVVDSGYNDRDPLFVNTVDGWMHICGRNILYSWSTGELTRHVNDHRDAYKVLYEGF